MDTQTRYSGKLKKVNLKINLKTAFMTGLVTMLGLAGTMSADAATISDDGKYALIMDVMDGDINGEEYGKMIRFDVEDGETTVKLSELTAGMVPFSNGNEFEYWGKGIFGDERADEEIPITDFNYSGTFGDESYSNGYMIQAVFSDKVMQGTGTYYLTLDPFGGTLNGKKKKLRLTSKSSEYTTVDLSEYTAVRPGYTFVGWAMDGNFVTSVDSSYFADKDAVQVTATYKKNSFDGDYTWVTLNANGGTIDGKASEKYDYVGGGNSATDMSVFQYVPVREGYTFNGWNTKSDGSGSKVNYLYWAYWRNEGESIYERDTLVDNMYKNLILYASWTKNAEEPATSEQPTTPEEPTTPKQPAGDNVKEIQSTGDVKTNIEFADGINKAYKVDIKKVEIKKELADKNVKFIADINVLNGDSLVKISDTKMKISIAMPDDLKGYNKYEAVYILNDEIKETIPATVENGNIVFETSHLSQYGIVATNVETTDQETTASISQTTGNKTATAAATGNKTAGSPKTGDENHMMLWIAVLALSCTGVVSYTMHSRRKKLDQ